MAINLRDYSRTAAQRGWGAGWPSCSAVKGQLATVVADRSGTRVTVHQRIARLADLLLDWTEHPDGGNYLLKPGQCGGYNCRAVGGTTQPSNHSWALALDINWSDNPYTESGRRTIPDRVARTWNRYGWAWGGDYTGPRKDWMHLEFMGTPADADAMTALATRELTGATPATPITSQGPRDLRLGMSGDDVARLQQILKTQYSLYGKHLVVDGDFGPATVAVVKEFQRRSGLAVDGIVGPRTRTALRL